MASKKTKTEAIPGKVSFSDIDQMSELQLKRAATKMLFHDVVTQEYIFNELEKIRLLLEKLSADKE